MLPDSFWISGTPRSGKTTRLVDQFCLWSQTVKPLSPNFPRRQSELQRLAGQRVPAILVLAANGDNRLDLADRIAAATSGRHSFHSTTPLGFFEDEVVLFWPLLVRSLDLRAQFPLRLRPETEQELAAALWRPEIDQGILRQTGVGAERMVRRTLDLFQLAALSGTPTEEIPSILAEGFADDTAPASLWTTIGELLAKWRQWCLARGLLTYGIICELYAQYLLNDSTYQQHLAGRYQAVLADDVDEYPAISRRLFDFLLDRGAAGAFTYNPDGSIRLGLGADPEYMAGLQERCLVENLYKPIGLAKEIGEAVVDLAVNAFSFYPSNFSLPTSVRLIHTTSRADLLRKTTEGIIDLVQSKAAQPEEIAVIAPGLDAIARYSLIEILTSHDIPVESLNDQRPLSTSPIVRSLLTLLALIYPGLGRLVNRDAAAEMLVVLSQPPAGKRTAVFEPDPKNSNINPATLHNEYQTSDIDPVRAGLIADHCFCPDPENPRLLTANTFARWDRLGHRATTAYEQILEWIELQRSHQQQHLIPSPIVLLDRAIQQFLLKSRNLPYNQLAALRELMETAVHYWEIDPRVRSSEPAAYSQSATVAQFIQLLRRGTITANPFPVRSAGLDSRAIAIATIFQYRASRRAHKWHFWLDAGSSLWMSGGTATLFAAPLFLQKRLSRPNLAEDKEEADQQRLRRILLDLLSRTSSLYLCHSELAANGQEQTGPLLPLVYASMFP
ncbi:MAG TPA: recombinase family protein [Kamptonema sp.]|nr:recombinase family protein [Kamptonema sp.]